jgi:hypothetical protein
MTEEQFARTKPIKLGVELTPAQRQFLRDFPKQANLLSLTKRATIPGADVVRALIQELEASEDLQLAVAKRIAGSEESPMAREMRLEAARQPYMDALAMFFNVLEDPSHSREEFTAANEAVKEAHKAFADSWE